MAKYVDLNGLLHLYKKVVSLINAKADATDATTTTSGMMSAADKQKLNGIEAGANNYSHPITSGNKHIPSGGSSGKVLKWKADGEAQWGDDNNTTYDAATQSANGLMSTADKKKLDGIAAGANAYTHPASHPASMITGLASVATSGSYNDLSNKPTIPAAYTHPTTAGNKHIPSGGSTGQILKWKADGEAQWGAENSVTVDSALSTTSANPVQNKIVKAELDKKLPLTGGTVTGNLNTSNLYPSDDNAKFLGSTSKRWAQIIAATFSATNAAKETVAKMGVRVNGTASAVGESLVQIGNNIAEGTDGNQKGYLEIYNKNGGYISMSMEDGNTSKWNQTIPAQTGSVLILSTANQLQAEVKAGWNKQTPGTSMLRNSMLSTTASNPTNNGEIVWQYS